MPTGTGAVTNQLATTPGLLSSPPWLVMVYMAGDNSLTEEMVLALQDLMGEGAKQGNVMVAQFDPGGAGIATQRYVFSGAASAGPVTYAGGAAARPKLDHFQFPEFDGIDSSTGDEATLADFIDWAWDQVPRVSGSNDPQPMQTLLVLSGHGSGTTEDFFMKDDASADALTFEELTDVLKQQVVRHGEKIDVLGLDACYMCMGELAYEVRDGAGILIGPEGLEPAFGWPYRKILAAIQASAQPMDPETLAQTVVREYASHYADYDRAAGRSADMAALRLGQFGAVSAAFANLVSALGDEGVSHDSVLLAHWYAQTYKADQFVDLLDLAWQLKRLLPGQGRVVQACEQIEEALLACVIVSRCSGYAVQYLLWRVGLLPLGKPLPGLSSASVRNGHGVGELPPQSS